jgi:hypothetical protein
MLITKLKNFTFWITKMYNNEVTYHKKWDTPENKAALTELQRKFFPRSQCSPSTPTAWAPEVLDMLNNIDAKLGIELNCSSMEGYYIRGTVFNWFCTDPIRGLYYGGKQMFAKPSEYGTKKTKLQKLAGAIGSGLSPINYGFRACKIKYLNPLLNKINKPKVSLSQIKEKYGYLNLYMYSPEHEEFLNAEKKACVDKLIAKGAYYQPKVENVGN